MSQRLERAISSLSKNCHDLFLKLLVYEPWPEDVNLDISREAVEEELGRFRRWAGNIGAFQVGPTSLDERLEKVPWITQQIRRVLQDVERSIFELIAIVSGQRAQRREEEVCFDFEQEFDDETSAGSDDEGEDNTSQGPINESQSLFGVIIESITTLLKYSMAIRKARRQDPFTRAARLPEWDFTSDVNHIEQTWPKLRTQDWLAKRLGQALSRRRRYFQYEQNHHEALSKSSVDDSKSRMTKASSLVTMAEADMKITEPTDDVSDSGFSSTTYGTVYDVDETSEHARIVPAIPSSGIGGAPFECPYCYKIIVARDTQSWRKHVYRDLRPYTCTHQDCDALFFIGMHEWFSHELSEHRQARSCCLCSQTCPSKTSLMSHLRNSHESAFTDIQLPTVISSCRSVEGLVNIGECPFCDDWLASEKRAGFKRNREPQDFRNHVARHLRQLALFALPRLTTDVDTGSEEEQSNEVNEREIDSPASNSSEHSKGQGEGPIGKVPTPHRAPSSPIGGAPGFASESLNMPGFGSETSSNRISQGSDTTSRNPQEELIDSDSMIHVRQRGDVVLFPYTNFNHLPDLDTANAAVPTPRSANRRYSIGSSSSYSGGSDNDAYQAEQTTAKMAREAAIEDYERDQEHEEQTLATKISELELEKHEMKGSETSQAALNIRAKEKERYTEERLVAEDYYQKRMEKAAEERAAAEEYIRKKKGKEKMEEEDQNKIIETRVKLRKSGMSEEQIETNLNRIYPKTQAKFQTGNIVKPLYPKIRVQDIAPETLKHYKLPWIYDENDSNYIIIMQEMSVRETDIMFKHTTKIRKRGPGGYMNKADRRSALDVGDMTSVDGAVISEISESEVRTHYKKSVKKNLDVLRRATASHVSFSGTKRARDPQMPV